MKAPINYPAWVERAALLIEQAYKQAPDPDGQPNQDEIMRIILAAQLGLS